MAISRKEEARALDVGERELVERSHQPAVQALADAELADLVKLMRERRDKAQSEAHRRRREMRGKGKPKGASSASKSDLGSQAKLSVIAMAMRRLNAEAERRRQLAAGMALVENAHRALALKAKAPQRGPEFNTRHAHRGMRAAANEKAASLTRPMECGRQRKAGQVAQAKRDAR